MTKHILYVMLTFFPGFFISIIHLDVVQVFSIFNLDKQKM